MARNPNRGRPAGVYEGMQKIARGFMIVTLLLAAGCGTTAIGTGAARGTPTARLAVTGGTAGTGGSASTGGSAGTGSTAGAGGGCARGEIGPMDASFVSASDGWLIGVTLRHCWQYGGSRLVVRETTDGGRHWSPVSAPPAPVPWSGGAQIPPAASVSEIYFASARDGWAFGPGLWATHDGGASWHRVGTHGRGVYSLAASGGHAVAAFDSCGTNCGRGTASSFAIATAPIGSDAWRPVPGAAGEGEGEPQVTAAGGTAYALTGGDAGNPNIRARLLSGPADGSAPWHARATPCYAMGANTVTAVTAARLVMACALLGAHPATTRFYRTDNHGAHWRQFSWLGLYDGASCVSLTGDGTLLAGGNYDGVAMSYDGGRSWHRPATVDASPQVGGGGEIVAAMTADRDGFVITPWGPLWITRDGGHTWTPVIVR